MTPLKGIPRIAFVVSLVIAGFAVIQAFFPGPLMLLPAAAIPVYVAIGIRRGQVITAYGFASYLVVQILVTAILLATDRTSAVPVAESVGTVIFGLAVGVLFWLAGRSLAKSGGTGGTK